MFIIYSRPIVHNLFVFLINCLQKKFFENS
nr:MAG TPA: hypothetical protein [Caudoviricetes sp.]